MADLRDKKPAWFRSNSHCRFSNLPVIHPEVLPPIDPASDYRLEIAKLGSQILLLKASGFVTSSQMVETLRFSDDYIAKNFKKTQRIVVIEDYANLKGTDFEARKKYFDYYKKRTFFIGAILYNMLPLIKFSLKLATRLHFGNKDGHVVDSYEQAIHSALAILNQPIPHPEKAAHPSPFVKNVAAKSKIFKLFKRTFSLPARLAINLMNKIKEIVIKEYSENLLKFIESIEWKEDGFQTIIESPDTNQSIRKIFNAITAMKTETDMIIKERLQVEKGLRESEKKFRQLIEHANAGICELDYDTNKFITANDSFLNITGYTKDEILSMSPTDLLTDDGRQQFNKRVSGLYSGETISPDCVYQIVTKRKDIKWVIANTSFKYRNNRLHRANIILTDITKLKTTENKLIEYQEKLKNLSIQLSMSEEEQRKLLASELHDKVGQELFVAQLQLDSFEKSLNNPVQIKEISNIKEQIIRLITETRNLICELSPTVLYELGLKEAIEALAEATESKHNLHVAKMFIGDMDQFPDEIKFILYRSIKELIHNTIKHAHAKNITISIRNLIKTLDVVVKDDGIGFDIKSPSSEKIYPNVGFGLFDIKEKINHLGGEVDIYSAPDSGTSIHMKVPLAKEVWNAFL